MKELISAVIFVVGVAGGTAALKTLHDNVRKAAQGLPSLSEINKGLRKRN
jgi:hypothetical protein